MADFVTFGAHVTGNFLITKVPCESNQFYKLGRWVSTQQVLRNKLSERKIALLESIGFDLQVLEQKLNRTAWMVMYHLLNITLLCDNFGA